jgi:hypothetical protein
MFLFCSDCATRQNAFVLWKQLGTIGVFSKLTFQKIISLAKVNITYLANEGFLDSSRDNTTRIFADFVFDPLD